MASMTYRDPDLEMKRRNQEGDRQRKIADTDMQNRRMAGMQNESTRNSLVGQQYALDQSNMMQGNGANRRSVTDTSMNIQSPADETGGGGQAARKLPMGGFGSSNPQIDGRYMSLIDFEMPKFDENNPAYVQMGQDDFTPGDATAYQDAAFARLKAKSGQAGTGAVQSLAAQLAGRGISGQSGTFGRGLGDRVAGAVQPLSDLNVEHLGQEYSASQRARELSAQRSNAIYQGGITQRGQDLGSKQALNNLRMLISQLKQSGGINQRGQDLDMLYKMLDR